MNRFSDEVSIDLFFIIGTDKASKQKTTWFFV